MYSNSKLQKLKTEIQNKQDEKEKLEVQLSQLENREKQIRKMINIKEQKKRNHRLIERGAILESFIEGASEKSNEEIKGILQNLFQKS